MVYFSLVFLIRADFAQSRNLVLQLYSLELAQLNKFLLLLPQLYLWSWHNFTIVFILPQLYSPAGLLLHEFDLFYHSSIHKSWTYLSNSIHFTTALFTRAGLLLHEFNLFYHSSIHQSWHYFMNYIYFTTAPFTRAGTTSQLYLFYHSSIH